MEQSAEAPRLCQSRTLELLPYAEAQRELAVRQTTLGSGSPLGSLGLWFYRKFQNLKDGTSLEYTSMNPLHFYPAYVNLSGLSVALWSTVLWRVMAPGPACIEEAAMTHR